MVQKRDGPLWAIYIYIINIYIYILKKHLNINTYLLSYPKLLTLPKSIDKSVLDICF